MVQPNMYMKNVFSNGWFKNQILEQQGQIYFQLTNKN